MEIQGQFHNPAGQFPNPSPSPNPNPSQVWLDPAATPQSVTVFEEAHGAGGGKGGAVCRSPLQHLTVAPS